MKNCTITNLSIQNYRSIADETFEFRPLTVFTGKNGSGKSSVLNAMLVMAGLENITNLHAFRYFTTPDISGHMIDFTENRNKFTNEREIKININNSEFDIKAYDKADGKILLGGVDFVNFDTNFYYLNANRNEIRNIVFEDKMTGVKFGLRGEFVEQFYEYHASDEVENVRSDASDATLASNVSFWLGKILEKQAHFKTQKDNQYIKSKFVEGRLEFLPTNVATGLNYLTKILVVGLSCKKGDVFVVENPEIHLHPKAVANLTEFFSFLASNGVQCVVETHSDVFVSHLAYRIFKQEISSDDIIIYNKNRIDETFQKVEIVGKHFKSNGKIGFPDGFFDAGSEELLEMYQ